MIDSAFKAFNISLVGPQAYLASPSIGTRWESNELLSDFKGSLGAFESTNKGIYALKEPEELARGGYWVKDRWYSVVGELIPYGLVSHGETGYRMEKASLSAIYRGEHFCELCEKLPGRIILKSTKLVGNPRTSSPGVLLCIGCAEAVHKALPKAKLAGLDEDQIWAKLEDRYQVPIKRFAED